MEPLQIELESAETHSGGDLVGTVRLAGELTRCRRLTYALAYDITYSTASSTVMASGVLREGPLPEGRERTVPFRLKVPEDAPTSYAGKGFNLIWTLTVTADLALARDPVARAIVVVRPRPDNVGVAAPTRYRPPPRNWPLIILAWVLVPPVAAVVAALIAMALIVLAPVTVVVGALWLLRWLRVAECRLVLTPAEGLKLGEPLKYVLTFRTRKRFRVNAVSVRLEGAEHWSTGSGKHSESHTAVFHQDEHRVAEQAELPRGWFRQTGEFRLGPELPATAGTHLVYKAIARVDIPWWPDVVRTVPVKVLPVIATADPGPPANPTYTVRRERD